MSKLIVKDIWAEDLFKYFYDHVMNSCGDGAAVIVCENYKEVADWFVEWWKNKIRPNFSYAKEYNFWHPKYENENSINFHDSNENFIFTNNKNINLFHGNYIFIIEEDCKFGFARTDSEKIVKKIK